MPMIEATVKLQYRPIHYSISKQVRVVSLGQKT